MAEPALRTVTLDPELGPMLDPDLEFLHRGDARLLMRAVEEVRAAVEACLSKYVSAPFMSFAWPTDGIMKEPWGYFVHVGWVQGWNDEGRTTPAVEFVRKWMADDRNVLLALLASSLRDLANTRALVEHMKAATP